MGRSRDCWVGCSSRPRDLERGFVDESVDECMTSRHANDVQCKSGFVMFDYVRLN
jgi:hypothetical protein